jgi:hypothetical protein
MVFPTKLSPTNTTRTDEGSVAATGVLGTIRGVEVIPAAGRTAPGLPGAKDGEAIVGSGHPEPALGTYIFRKRGL